MRNIDSKTAVDWCLFSLFQLFIRELVRNLFNEGNDVYREGDWRGSLSHYTEAINIADYANSEEIHVSDDILEKLHVNRIACFSNMVSFYLNSTISQEQCAKKISRHGKVPSEWKALGADNCHVSNRHFGITFSIFFLQIWSSRYFWLLEY